MKQIRRRRLGARQGPPFPEPVHPTTNGPTIPRRMPRVPLDLLVDELLTDALAKLLSRPGVLAAIQRAGVLEYRCTTFGIGRLEEVLADGFRGIEEALR